MKIETSWISKKTGKKVLAYYEETDDFSLLPKDKIKSICAYLYFDGKFIIVKNEGNWQPVAGHVEPGESIEDALIREVKEESNMKVLKYFPLGYLYTYGGDIYQARYLAIVEPYGDFVSDPDGGVTEVKFIDPHDTAKYIDWKDTANFTTNKSLSIIEKLKKS